jgi:hypothetical protein
MNGTENQAEFDWLDPRRISRMNGTENQAEFDWLDSFLFFNTQ